MNVIATLVQVVQSDPLGPVLVQGATVLILGLQAWNVKMVSGVRDRMIAVETVLNNGLRSDVKEIKTAVTQHGQDIAALKTAPRRGRRKTDE